MGAGSGTTALGLVRCAETGERRSERPDHSPTGTLAAKFPDGKLIGLAADELPAELPRLRSYDEVRDALAADVGGTLTAIVRSSGQRRVTSRRIREGPQWEIVPGPGCVQVRTRDYARADRRAQRERKRRLKLADVAGAVRAAAQRVIPEVEALTISALEFGAIYDDEVDDFRWQQLADRVGGMPAVREPEFESPADVVDDWDDWDEEEQLDTVLGADEREPSWRFDWSHPPTLELRPKIFGWSRKSRNELRHKMGKLDLSPVVDPGWLPETVTLTYPGVGDDPDAPDDRFWLPLAPGGAAVKRALQRFRKRFEYRWGRYADGKRIEPGETVPDDAVVTQRPFYGVLKLEFQERGAPHLHIAGALPADDRYPGMVHRDFRGWLSEAWAECAWAELMAALPDPDRRGKTLGRKWMNRPEIVLEEDGTPSGRGYLEVLNAHHPGAMVAFLDHRKVGTRVGSKDTHGPMTDPRRFTSYFLKEGQGGAAKAYQDRPPEQWAKTGTGRIWQVWGFREATAPRAVTPEDGIAAGRVMRRWYRSEIRRDVERASRLPFGPCRDKQEQGLRDRAVRLRRARGLFQHNRGRVMVNDGERFTLQLARALRLPKLTPSERAARLLGVDQRRVETAGAGLALMRRLAAGEVNGRTRWPVM